MSMNRLILFLLLSVSPLVILQAEEQKPAVPVITIEDSIINPVVTEYLIEAIDRAEREQAPALVIELDTPGGLLSSTRVIVKKMMNANVPILVYVAPSGSRAGSAGVFITLAAHVAAMAPSTNIGAAHPVEFGESPRKEKESFKEFFEEFRKEEKKKERKRPKEAPGDTMSEKIVNDTVAWVSAIAKTRGRNVDWAVRAVKESISSREDEALRFGVVDFVAKDLEDLLKQAEGKRVTVGTDREVVLRLAGLPVARVGMTMRQKILNVLINPNIAYILMILGFYGLLFEITHPGVWFPGVAGLVCLILAFYAFHTLPTNYAGLALIFLAIALFIAEVKVTSYGLLSLAGVICMLLGSLFLVDSTAAFMQISLTIIIPVVLSTAAIFVFLISLAVRAHRQKGVTGVEGLIGASGEVTVALPNGKVMVEGEIWDATADRPVKKGEKVRIVSVEGMKLTVKKM
jgi:membrane-bound serine protease (ClpP class)